MFGNSVQSAPKQWLIVVLIYADFTDTTTQTDGNVILGLEAMLKDLFLTPLNPDMGRLFVIMDCISYFDKNSVSYIRNTVGSYKFTKAVKNNYNEVSEYRILFNLEDEISAFSAPDRGRYKRHVLQNGKYLGEILSSIEVKQDEALMLLTWDHGSGFGIFPLLTTLTEPTISLETKLSSSPTIRYLLTLSETDPNQNKILGDKDVVKSASPELLTNKELNEALRVWMAHYGKKSVDVLLMMNCWMMNMHTMYAMKSIVTYLVAPQTDIGNPGYNYSSIITFLHQPPQPPMPHDLAVHCVESRYSDDFRQKVKKMKLPSSTVDECIVAAIFLQATDASSITTAGMQEMLLDQLFAQLGIFFNLLLRSFNDPDTGGSTKYLFRDARTITPDFDLSDVYIVDIFSYMLNVVMIDAELFNVLPDELSSCLTQTIRNSIQSKILVSGPLIGKTYAPDTSKYVLSNPTGYSIFFRRCPQRGVNPKVDYELSGDLLLSECLPQWQKILTAMFGE